jgi:M6 family metalloprotease-like protein
MVSIEAFAVVAYPYPIDVKQSDGSILTVQLKGDEKVNWAKTTDDYTLLRSKNGDFVYAVADDNGGMKPSEIIAHNPADRSKEEQDFVARLDKKLFFSQEQVSIMKQYWAIEQDFNQQKSQKVLSADGIEHYKMVVILMSYADLPFVASRQAADDLFNQVGYSVNGHQGSVHDYFAASSFNKLSVEATVLGPYTSIYNMAHYGTNLLTNQELIREAVTAANPYVDFSQYTNGEGNQVSCVYVIYAGFAASGGAYGTIWPHRSMLYPPMYVDGVTILDYGCSSETGNYAFANEPLKIGTICHEFGHVLGLPDFYDTDYDTNGQAYDPGEWDIMASGNYLNGERTPPLWNAYERSTRGYINIEELIVVGSNTLPPLSSDNRAYKMTNTSLGNNTLEYFILENRQKEGFDYYLPGHGMLIWHVDKTTAWSCINCNPDRQGFDLVEANGTGSRSGNPFPGTANHTSFTDNTTPNSNWNNYGNPVNSNKALTLIAENNQTKNIVFNYNSSVSGAPVVTTNAINYVSSDSINVGITVTQNSIPVTEKGLCYSSTSYVPNSSTSVIYTGSNATFNIGLSALQPATTYFVRAYAKANNVIYYGETMKVKTPCEVETLYPFVVSFEDNESLGCLDQQSDRYAANAWRYIDTAVEEGGIDAAYAGDKFAFVKNDYWGSSQNIKLVLAPVDISVLSQPVLKFHHAQKPKSSKQDNLQVYYKANASDQWTLLSSYNLAANDWTERTITLPNKSTTYYIAFDAVLWGGYGECVDNIRIIENDAAAFPSVQTISSSDFMDVSARVSANAVSNGHTPLTEKGICYSTQSNPTIADQKVTTTGSLGLYDLTLTDLLPATIYYAKAYARNEGVIAYGQEITFTTRCQRINDFPYIPVITSSDTLCIDNEQGWAIDNSTSAYKFSAASGFNSMLLLPIFNLQDREDNKIKFQYQQPINTGNIDTLKLYYKVGISSTWQLLKTYSTATTQWTLDSVELPDAANGYLLAFEGRGANGANIYVKDINIESVLQIPVVTTSSTTLATYNSIATGGNVLYGGVAGVTSRGICYSTHPSPTINDIRENSGSGVGAFSVTLSNLQPLTTYFIRAFAQNAFGTAYGQLYVITTPPTPIFNNTITGGQTLCAGGVADNIGGSTPSGGNGIFNYIWQSKAENSDYWEHCGTDYKDYIVSQIFSTTSFRRIVVSGSVSDTSNAVTIVVYPTSKGGNVFKGNDTIALGDTVSMELRVSVGDVLYWQKHKINYNWQDMDNTAGLTTIEDSPAEIGYWYYRAIVRSGICDTAVSGEDRVYVSQYVGLSNIDNQDSYQINISPNPTYGELKININKPLVADITFVDAQGKIAKEFNLFALKEGDNAFDVSDLQQGYYVLKVDNKEFNWQDRIIIIKK